jgi:hypothetical protein
MARRRNAEEAETFFGAAALALFGGSRMRLLREDLQIEESRLIQPDEILKTVDVYRRNAEAAVIPSVQHALQILTSFPSLQHRQQSSSGLQTL